MLKNLLPPRTGLAALLGAVLCVPMLAAQSEDAANTNANPSPDCQRHVLLISIDGMHSVDLKTFIGAHPHSTLAALRSEGVYYPLAYTSRPSDSFPGLLSIVTGGSPRLTGVYYDSSYDRNLVAPGGGPGSPRGTAIVYDETIDKDTTQLDGGGGIDPAKLPLNPDKGFAPVYPHDFLRVNTVFEVIKAHGLRTAWSDKHPAYDVVNGPSGQGVDDLYTPEINSDAGNGQVYTDTVALTEKYDTLKVEAILNEIRGNDHSGLNHVGVPAVFGMNFQTVSVAQKDAHGGYQDAIGTPGPELEGALDYVDQALGNFVQGLKNEGLFEQTVIIVTAKHGQSPIDRSKRQIIPTSLPVATVNAASPDLVAKFTGDDVGLFWLRDGSQTAAAVTALAANQGPLGISEIFAGDSLKLRFGNPARDSRIPDIVITTNQGVIYAGQTATKIAEHGGFADDDTNVALLIATPGLGGTTVSAPVHTSQIAPTILAVLGLPIGELQSVSLEGTQPLSGLSR